MDNQVISYIGFGSNLGNSYDILPWTITQLSQSTRVNVCGYSSLYQSAPLGAQSQQDYINAVIVLKTGLAPMQLLAKLQALELMQGRLRTGAKWHARTLDLDILLYGQLRLRSEKLTIPHPEIVNRRFVMQPLLEIAPDILLPGHGPVAQIIKGLPPWQIKVMN